MVRFPVRRDDAPGFFYQSGTVFVIKVICNQTTTIMEEEKMTPQVRLTITTDLYYTAEFLRDVANAIEDEGVHCAEVETANGFASICWPEEAYEDEKEDEKDENGEQGTDIFAPMDDTSLPNRIENVLMTIENIKKAETALSLFGKPKLISDVVDEKSDYIRVRHYDMPPVTVHIYYDVTGKIGWVDAY